MASFSGSSEDVPSGTALHFNQVLVSLPFECLRSMRTMWTISISECIDEDSRSGSFEPMKFRTMYGSNSKLREDQKSGLLKFLDSLDISMPFFVAFDLHAITKAPSSHPRVGSCREASAPRARGIARYGTGLEIGVVIKDVYSIDHIDIHIRNYMYTYIIGWFFGDMEWYGEWWVWIWRCDTLYVFLVVDLWLELPAAFAGERHDFQCFAHSRWQGVASSAKGHWPPRDRVILGSAWGSKIVAIAWKNLECYIGWWLDVMVRC